MSYFPDWRDEKNYKHLNATDRAFLQGYRAAYEDALCVFDNIGFSIDIGDNIKLEIEEGTEQMDAIKDTFDEYMDDFEVQATVAIFDGADYLPEDLELEDINPPLFTGTMGARAAAAAKEAKDDQI